MSALTRYTRISILLLIIVYTAFSADLTEKQRLKLHPLFRSLITNSPQSLTKTSSKLNRIASTVSSDGIIRYGAIVYTRDVETLRLMGIHVNSVLPEFVTAQLTPSDMTRLANLESVKFLDPGKVHHPMLDVSVPETGAKLLQSGFINNTLYKGAGAIILIYDTGIDWKHFDFRKAGDTTKSRIKYIWDQTLTPNLKEHSPTGFTYGVEYTQAQIEGELNYTSRNFVREQDTHGHGTHVASIAAGNGQAFNNKYIGMAPEADIIVVKGGDESFYSPYEDDGLAYAQKKALELKEPIVVNMSLGGQEGPHDGTNDDEVAVDSFVNSNSGRVVCISAGNDGVNLIHANGAIANGSSAVIKINVPTYTPNSGTENDQFIFDTWLLNSNQVVNLSVQSPTGDIYSPSKDSSIDGLNRPEGTIDTWNQIETQNQHRHFGVWIHDAIESVPPKTGTWTITLTTTGSSVAYDGWLDSELGDGTTSANIIGGNTNKTVGMPGTAAGAITVGAYASKWWWYSYNNTGPYYYGSSTEGTNDISYFSSIGPTADGRQKPEIAAPGQTIVAALSSDEDITNKTAYIVTGQKDQAMAGTSMSCPHVTGGTALLLGANPSLTAAQIKALYTSTANSDVYTTAGLPNYIWGYGKFDILEAMAKSIRNSASVMRTTLAYDGTAISNSIRVTGTAKAAVRFSPTTSGILTGIQVYMTSLSNRPIAGIGPLVCDVYTDNAGLPGTKIGSVSQPFSLLSPFTNNYIQMTSANVNVTSGIAYYVVLSVANMADSVLVRYENVTSGSHSLMYNGSSWSAQAYNLRIRSIITTTSGLTGIKGSSALQPLEYHLEQNYPNPFNPTTNIEYCIPTKGVVKLRIFDILGRSVATLVDGVQDAGVYHTTWTGKTSNGVTISSGVYFYRLESGSFIKTERMLFLK